MKNETHLPAEQTPQKKNDRVPRQNENSRRPEGHQPPPPRRAQDPVSLSRAQDPVGLSRAQDPVGLSRAQDSVGLNRSSNHASNHSRFPKEARLRSRREFQRIAKEGQRRVGRFLCVDVRFGDRLKLGISASGRYGASHERNRFKRLVREAFRKNYSLLPPRLELNVIPRQIAKKAGSADIADELMRLLC